VRAQAEGSRVLVSHEMPGAAIETLQAFGYEVVPACGGAISVAPLIPGVRGGLRIGGRSRGISIRGRIGLVVARAAGAICATESGAVFPESVAVPARALIVAASGEDAEVLSEAARAGLRRPG
jgi:hypothetical protein